MVTTCHDAQLKLTCAICIPYIDISLVMSLCRGHQHIHNINHLPKIQNATNIIPSIAFIASVRGKINATLSYAVIDQAPNRLRPILTDVHEEIPTRADIIGARYWVRSLCTLDKWNNFLSVLGGIIDEDDVYKWTSGENNNRQVRAFPDANVVAKVLVAPWLTSYIDRAINIDRHDKFVDFRSIPKTSSITEARHAGAPFREWDHKQQ